MRQRNSPNIKPGGGRTLIWIVVYFFGHLRLWGFVVLARDKQPSRQLSHLPVSPSDTLIAPTVNSPSTPAGGKGTFSFLSSSPARIRSPVASRTFTSISTVTPPVVRKRNYHHKPLQQWYQHWVAFHDPLLFPRKLSWPLCLSTKWLLLSRIELWLWRTLRWRRCRLLRSGNGYRIGGLWGMHRMLWGD